MRVRERIRSRESRAWWGVGWSHWAVAMAASVALCFGIWLNYSRGRLPALSDRPEEMKNQLGPSYKGLLPLVAAAVPRGFHVIMAHQCGYAGRKYIHLTLQNGTELLSLVITESSAASR
jgi:hypothetical protein